MDSIKNKLDTMTSVQKNTGEINTYDYGHSGHSSFIEKLIINKKFKIKKVENRIEKYKENNRESTMSTVSKPEAQTIPDQRFNSPQFRAAVRTVLEYFGHEGATYKDFKEVEQKFSIDGRCCLDWFGMADRIIRPRYDAVVYVLDGLGRRVVNSRGYVCRGLELYGRTRVEALCGLDCRLYEFAYWFDLGPHRTHQDGPGRIISGGGYQRYPSGSKVPQNSF